MTKSRYLGVDGCKAGWFFVSIGPGDETEIGVFQSIDQLFYTYPDSRWILIDIPIGLPSKELPRRNCDIEARKLLGPKKASSVFPPPCREAIKASNYIEANKIIRAVLAKGMSQQTFHICKKIKETDDFLHRHKKFKKIVRESHPEICFWALSGRRRLEHNKKTPKGLEERLEILIRHFPKASSIYKAALDRYLRKEVSRDDILDAMALAITATNLSARGKSLPEKPEKDTSGLTMEIVYALPENSQNLKKFCSEDVIPPNILKVLYNSKGNPRSPQHIRKCVGTFNKSYKITVYEVIRDTADGVTEKIFCENVSKLMANFKMTRGGPFKGVKYYNGSLIDPNGIVVSCWEIAHKHIIQIRSFLDEKNKGNRSRALIELSESDRKLVVSKLWIAFKKLLPICMSDWTWGLVAASKVLFAVLPEIAQPIDNVQWRKVFRTIDYSDVISDMAVEIVSWERQVGVKLDSCDPLSHTTLPAVYNVMAMKARPTS